MKLEAVNPQNHEEIHVANIVAVVEHMVCVELLPIGDRVWYAQKSDLLFPVGWCDSNNYELHFPDLKLLEQELEKEKEQEAVKEESKKFTEEWCDR